MTGSPDDRGIIRTEHRAESGVRFAVVTVEAFGGEPAATVVVPVE